MRKLIILLLIILWGCAGKPAPIKQKIKIIEDRQSTELSAEQAARNKDYTYRKVDGQENIPVLERSVFLIKKDGRILPITVQELYNFIETIRIQLYQIIRMYNYFVDRLIEIHEHPDLDINLTEIPEKANIRWFIPIYYR